MDHPDRMRVANDFFPKDRPVATKSIDEDEFEKAIEELRSVDERIPTETLHKAVKLLFSTNLLPDYDLSTCYTMDFHSANMIALIMPLPDTGKFQMPFCLATARITFGHYFMAPRFLVRNRSCWKARLDRQIGFTTAIHDDAMFHHLVHFTWDVKWQTMT